MDRVRWDLIRPEDRLPTAAVVALAAVPLQVSANPLRQATMIAKAGRERLGVRTTHYRMTLDRPHPPHQRAGFERGWVPRCPQTCGSMTPVGSGSWR